MHCFELTLPAACLRQVRNYVWVGIPHKLATAAAAAWATADQATALCNMDLHSCAAACAAVFHAPFPLQHLELQLRVVRLQAAWRGSVARTQYRQARSSALKAALLFALHPLLLLLNQYACPADSKEARQHNHIISCFCMLWRSWAGCLVRYIEKAA